MPKYNHIIFRQFNNKYHFLNYFSGKIYSFSQDDGANILDILKKEVTLDSLLDPSLAKFFGQKRLHLQSRKFRGHLLDLGQQFTFPTIVNIELNRRCLLNCQHCYIDETFLKSKKSEHFDTYQSIDIENFLSQLVDLGAFLVVFTGGEPFLNNNIKEFVKIAKK